MRDSEQYSQATLKKGQCYSEKELVTLHFEDSVSFMPPLTNGSTYLLPGGVFGWTQDPRVGAEGWRVEMVTGKRRTSWMLL